MWVEKTTLTVAVPVQAVVFARTRTFVAPETLQPPAKFAVKLLATYEIPACLTPQPNHVVPLSKLYSTVSVPVHVPVT